MNYTNLTPAQGAVAAVSAAPVVAESIASNHDAMIILTQGYPREAIIKVVDAHTARQIGKAAPVVAEGMTDDDIDTMARKHGLDGSMIVGHRRDYWRAFAGDLLAAHPVAGSPAEPFQQRVQPWMMACFGAEISADFKERNHRFLEESLELVQACDCTAEEAHMLVDYVYGRPVGEKHQEVGGVMVTLAALCLAQGLDMHDCGETELARIWTKVEAIRAKQAAKPKNSPLPAAAEPMPASEARTLPDGWVALSIIFDEDLNYPEEIAYGPPEMMERLRKKLDKYYAHIIAKRVAAPAPASEAASVPDDAIAKSKRILSLVDDYVDAHHFNTFDKARHVRTALRIALMDEFAAPAAPTDAKPDAIEKALHAIDLACLGYAVSTSTGYDDFVKAAYEARVALKTCTAAPSVRDAAQPTERGEKQ